MDDKNEIMRERVVSWGLPGALVSKKDVIEFKFNDDDITDTTETNYHCKDGDVKFCLYDSEAKKVLFSMDFFKVNSRLVKEIYVKLEFLYVHDEKLRKKGIASYFIGKLIGYAICEEVDFIKVHANANARNFKKDNKKNALMQPELEAFYEKRNTKEMPIKLLKHTL